MQKSTSGFRLFVLSTLLLLVSSCNIYRYVPEDDYLFTGSKITFDKKNEYESEIRSQLLSKTWPVENQKIEK